MDKKNEDVVEKKEQIDDESGVKKMPYPKSIAFIVTNEFCERFSFYGLRTILSIYLHEKLRYSDDDSVVIYHVFIMFAYFFPIFGAMIADSWLGKFKTILYLSIVYAIGSLLVAVTAIQTLGIPDRAFTIVGLLLVAIGTGGIKPCVSAFGGDQFKIPEQEKQLATFFSLFYFAINSGSFVSTFVTPILRMDVHCFDEEDCYPLAFGVPGILMVISIIVFVFGKFLYVIRKPAGNILIQVCKCIGHAISRRSKLKKQEKRDHWLEYADDQYDSVFINDIKAALKVLLLFIPLPVFWALFDQQGSRWTFQATRMNGNLGGGVILKPDQMQVVNPLLILILIPLFEVAIYPALRWCKIIRKPLHKMVLGGMLAAVAFLISAGVEINLETTYPVLPGEGIGHVRLYNGFNCDLNITATQGQKNFPIFLEKLSVYENKEIEVSGDIMYKYSVIHPNNCDGQAIDIKDQSFKLLEKKSISHFINDKSVIAFEDDSDKSSKGNPVVRLLKNFDGTVIFNEMTTGEEFLKITNDSLENRYELKPSTFTIYVGGEEVKNDVTLELGGVYSIIVTKMNAKTNFEIHEITPPNSIHMLWLIPQYVVLTMGEVMFSVTGLEFSFTQAPASMKSVLTAGWLLTVAFGNLIVVIVAEAQGFDSQVSEFFLFAGLMIVDMIIFWLMTLKYEYVEMKPTDDSSAEKIPLPEVKDEDATSTGPMARTVTNQNTNEGDESY